MGAPGLPHGGPDSTSPFSVSCCPLCPARPQCREGGFPQDLWLGVSADAVSVYKRGEGRPLEVFQYEHILSFGAPLANTYKIVVDERELLFETSEVRSDPRKPPVALTRDRSDAPFLGTCSALTHVKAQHGGPSPLRLLRPKRDHPKGLLYSWGREAWFRFTSGSHSLEEGNRGTWKMCAMGRDSLVPVRAPPGRSGGSHPGRR